MKKIGYFLTKDGFRCLNCDALVYPQDGKDLDFTETIKAHTDSHKKQEANK